MESDFVKLEIPASAEYLRLARLAAADIGARAGFSYEDIDDLRIAVDELCYAIGAADGSARLELSYRVSPGNVTVEGQCDGEAALTPPTELARAIVAAVVDSFSIPADHGQRSFQLVKSTPSSG